jgi:NTE family protein
VAKFKMKIFWKKKKVGIALGSGGPRGYAHIGVIKALEENNIPIDIVAGASAGSLIGGLYLALGSIAKVEKIVLSFKRKDLYSMFAGFGFYTGILKSDKVFEYLDNILQGTSIEDLNKPYAAVATNIKSGKAVALTEGNLAKAIKASCSVPIVLESTEINGNHFVDGGISNPVPVETAKELGADIVIAVNLDNYLEDKNWQVMKRFALKNVATASLAILQSNFADTLCSEADITIVPQINSNSTINIFEYINPKDKIEAGYRATIGVMQQIKAIVR